MSLSGWSFYGKCLACIAGVTIAVGVQQARSTAAKPNPASEERTSTGDEQAQLKRFKLNYLIVYGLVMASDWLQGPYLYSLYSEEFGIGLHTIAILFVLGFLSAGLTAPYIGTLADKHGRRLLCLTFCVTYALSCATKMVNSIALLSFGRLLGGVSTSILFSVFESWMVSTAKSKGMPSSDLGGLLGRCTLVNGLVASTSGLVSDGVVAWTGTFKAPFVASGLLLVLAGLVIRKTWSENYGSREERAGEESRPLIKALRVLIENPSLIALGVVMTCYETTMYLFVFIWVVALQDTQSTGDPLLPLGTIFSVYMVCMMLGSMIYTTVLDKFNADDALATPVMRRRSIGTASPPMSPDDKATFLHIADVDEELQRAKPDTILSPSSGGNILFHGQFATIVLMAASIAMAGAAVSSSTHWRFFYFALFEATVGLYYPILGALRASMIPEHVRASLSALFRVPLNLLVTLALVTGAEEHRQLVLRGSCLLLFSGALCSTLIIVRRAC